MSTPLNNRANSLASSSIADLVAMSLGTDVGSWWADDQFGSALHKLERGKLDGSTAGAVKQAAEGACSWLCEDGLAQSITVAAHREGRNRIDYTIEVRRPDGSSELIREVWHARKAHAQ